MGTPELRPQANLLASGIELPIAPVPGGLNGLRLGTPELARLGMTVADMSVLASAAPTPPGRRRNRPSTAN